MSDETGVNGQRPSSVAMLGSLLGAVEKDTEENIAERNAEALARQRAIIVHSPHALMPFETDAIRQMGRDPENFIGMAILGQLSAQRMPTGQTILALVMELPPGFFPGLETPAIMDANGNARSTKFDKQLALPITARVVLEKEGVGNIGGMKDNATLLLAHEGKTYGELQDAGYVGR